MIPRIDGVTVAARYWAAGALTEVGGDFYDVFAVGPDRWAVVIGDVCGIGPRADSPSPRSPGTPSGQPQHTGSRTSRSCDG